MTGQISSLYHLPTLIGTLHFLKLTTITVCKVIVDIIEFTLPLTTSPLVSTVYVECLNFSSNCFVRKCIQFFITTHWTLIMLAMAKALIVQTRLTEQMSTTHTKVRLSTGKVTYFTYKTINWGSTDEIVFISSNITSRTFRCCF